MVTASARDVALAWLVLCAALALHVVDEALTGFLEVYNPTVIAMRAQLPWFPMPVFTFGIWISGLVLLIVVLVTLTPWITRSSAGRVVAYAVAVLMVANALGHTAGTIAGRTVASVQFARPMPGFYSSPFLLAAAAWLIMRLRSRG